MKTNMNFNLFTPTKLLFGCGKLNELGNQSMPGKKALLLISNGQSVRTTGTLDRTVAQPAARCGSHHDFERVLPLLHRASCLRRTIREDGARDGNARCGQTRGFPHGTCRPATCLRRGQPENERLRLHS